MLPLKYLCIHPGKLAWVLYNDATCVNDDGNVFDAALIAMVTALKKSMALVSLQDVNLIILKRRCRSSHTANTLIVQHILVKTMSALDLKRLPIPMSFGIFEW